MDFNSLNLRGSDARGVGEAERCEPPHRESVVSRQSYRQRGLYLIQQPSQTMHNFIHLTKKGKEIAEKIYERHVTLMNYFLNLGVDPKVAQDDACAIEHVISDETFEALKKHYRKHHGV